MTPRTLIIVYSYHHLNTLAIAKTMGNVLQAEVLFPDKVAINTLAA